MKATQRFDRSRIRRLREALRLGQLEVDVEAVADRILDEARRAPTPLLQRPAPG